MVKIFNKIKNIFFKNIKENKVENKKITINYDDDCYLFCTAFNLEEQEKALNIFNKICVLYELKIEKIEEQNFFKNQDYPIAICAKLIKNCTLR